MDRLNKVKKILNKSFPNIEIKEKDNIIFLLGEVNSYNDKFAIGESIASLKLYEHVVNDIKVKGLIIPSTRYNKSINNHEFNNYECDVLIIGGGIIGTSILRELSKYNLNLILLEKEEDVGLHASSRNDGNIHPGIDLHRGTLKLKYLQKALPMWENLCKDLGVKYTKTSQIVTYTKNRFIINLYIRIKSKMNNISNVKFYNRRHFLKLEPNINKNVLGAVMFTDAAQISPYEVTIALAENAITNGAKILLNTYVKDMYVSNNHIDSVITNRGTFKPKVVINAAGVFSEDIAILAKDHFFSIHPRKGSDIILDKKTFNRFCKHTIGLKGLEDTHNKTKGGGFVVTVDNNHLLGPDAYEVPYKEDYITDKSSIINILNKQKRAYPNVSSKDIITYFSGIRACTYEEDFVIQKGKWTNNIVHAAGIQSPGLTCSPSIAKEITSLAISMLKNVKKKDNFISKRKAPIRINELSTIEKDKLIKQNPDYGIIVCRCEKISKGEIIDALNSPLLVNSVDAIKRRVRAGMGRCQGGFCEPQVLKIISDYKKIDMLDIKKKGDAPILFKKLKVGEQ